VKTREYCYGRPDRYICSMGCGAHREPGCRRTRLRRRGALSPLRRALSRAGRLAGGGGARRGARGARPHQKPPRPGHRGGAAARGASGSEAWLALYEEAVWTVEVELDGQSVAVYEALSYLRDPRRETRRTALRALDRALSTRADVVARCYDAVVTDRLAVDELRGYSSPRTERDLENELPAEVVDTMLETLAGHIGLVARWYGHKGRLLGIERLSIF